MIRMTVTDIESSELYSGGGNPRWVVVTILRQGIPYSVFLLVVTRKDDTRNAVVKRIVCEASYHPVVHGPVRKQLVDWAQLVALRHDRGRHSIGLEVEL